MRVKTVSQHSAPAMTALALFFIIASAHAIGSTIHSSQSGDWADPGTWIGSTVPTSSDSVVVDNGHVITLSNNGFCASLFVNAGNMETGVVLDTTGVLAVIGGVEVLAPTTNNPAYLDGCDGVLTVGGHVNLVGGSNGSSHARLMIAGGESTVGGSIMMNNNRARVTFGGNGTLFVAGDFSGDGVVNPAAGTIVLNGPVQQSIGGYTFTNLTIANSAGVSLAGNATVNGILRFESGNVFLGSSNLSLGPNAVIEGATESGYVVTDGSGRLEREVLQSDVGFPVGTVSSYNPLTLQIELGAETFAVGVEESVVPAIQDVAACVQQTWVVTETVPGGNGLLGVIFQWSAPDEGSSFDRSSAVCWRYDGVQWTQDGTPLPVTGEGPYSAPVPGLTSDGRFTIGNPGAVTSVKDEEIPGRFSLSQNFPNPFNPATHINFSVEEKGMATLSVFNVLGQQVAILFEGIAEPGVPYSITFNAEDLGSGIYFYELRSRSHVETRRMVYVR